MCLSTVRTYYLNSPSPSFPLILGVYALTPINMPPILSFVSLAVQHFDSNHTKGLFTWYASTLPPVYHWSERDEILL